MSDQGRQHATRGRQRAFGRNHHVQRISNHHGQQNITKPHDLAAIDRGVDLHSAEPLGGLHFQSLINRLGQRFSIATEQQEVQQAVLERRGILFDGVRRVERIDAPHHQRQDIAREVISPGG